MSKVCYTGDCLSDLMVSLEEKNNDDEKKNINVILVLHIDFLIYFYFFLIKFNFIWMLHFRWKVCIVSQMLSENVTSSGKTRFTGPTVFGSTVLYGELYRKQETEPSVTLPSIYQPCLKFLS